MALQGNSAGMTANAAVVGQQRVAANTNAAVIGANTAVNRRLAGSIRSSTAAAQANSAGLNANAAAVNRQGAAAQSGAGANERLLRLILSNTTALRANVAGLNANAAGIAANTANIAANNARLQANTTAMGRQTTAAQANTASVSANTGAITTQTAAMQGQTAVLNSLTSALEQQNRLQAQARISAAVARAEIQRYGNQADRARASTNMLTSSLRGLAGAYLGLRGIVGIGGLSDALVSNQARINLINDGLQTTVQLQDMIYQSANRARGSYLDMQATVSKLGLLAGQAFDSNAELVAFTELLSKNFVIGGTSGQEQSAAMYQLTQAMASGRLQGDEYRSIIENAPLLAQSIEDYMRNVQGAVGTMKDWASEGRLTADVIKAAMFNSADEVEKRFAEMPVTWAQVWRQAQNMAIKTFQPLLHGVGKMAGFVSEHIEAFSGAIYGAALAWGAYTVAQWAATEGTIAHTIATRGLMAALSASPLLLLIVAFAAVGAAVNAFITHCGGAKAAWLTFVDVVLTFGNNLAIGLVSIFYYVQNKLDETALHFQAMGVNIANGFGDLKASVLKHLQDLVNGGIGYVNKFIGVLNKIPGVNIAPVAAQTFGDTAINKSTASKAARNTVLNERTIQVAMDIAVRSTNISAMKEAGQAAHAARVIQIEQARQSAEGESFDYNKFMANEFGGAIANNTASIAGDTKAIKNSIDMSDETLKMLVDMAERRFVNNINLTAQSPVIQVQGQNTGDTMTDRYKLADTLRDVLLEQMSAGATRSTAMAF